MADRTLDVYLDGTLAGALAMTSSGAVSFTYDDTYRRTTGATPLSLSMPKATPRHRQRAVLPFIQGLLPDNERAIASLATSYRVSARSPFAILEHIGHDVAGALQLIEPGGTSEDATRNQAAPTPISDGDVAHELRNVIDVYRTGRPLLGADRLRMSLAGAQPKTALVRLADGTWARPERGTPTTHILKPEFRTPRTPEDERFPDLTTVEAFGLAVARYAGLRSTDASYWESPDGDVRALVLERFDRAVGGDGTVRRLHQEDLCQAMSVPPEKKYQHRDGGPGVGAIGELLRNRVPAPDRFQVARELLALLTLNIALVNTDAHAKNYALLLDGDSVRLAPAYDVLSIAPYESRDSTTDPISFPMRIGDTFRIRSMLPGTIAKEGERLGLDAEESRGIVDRILDSLPGALESARQVVADIPGGTAIADRTIHNLRAISPLQRA